MSAAFVLFVVFLVLKLCGVIAWSWWLVTMPLWIGFAIVVAVMIFGGGLVAAFAFFDRTKLAKRFNR